MNTRELYKLFLKSNGISIDSRTIQPGEIFFALKGDVFDGHRFVEQAMEKGAFLVVIQDEQFKSGEQFILVEDSLKCLQELALYHRQQFDIPVIGLTGSNGKTTTKELLMTALSSTFKVHATKGNFNNHIGVPLTILATPLDTEIMIVEMGANHIGEIDFLCHLSEPDHGLITNIGDAHIEGFGSREGVIIAKTELYRYLSQDKGIIFYNPEDEVLVDKLPVTTQNIPYNTELEFFENSDLTIGFRTKEGREYNTHIYGIFNEMNITAAYSVAWYFGVPVNVICESIAAYIPEMNRSQLIEKESITFIMDAYNANPSSMRLGIDSFSKLETNREKSIVLGDMLELGDNEIEYHRELVDMLSGLGFKRVILVGGRFEESDPVTEFTHYLSVDQLLDDREKVITILQDTVCLVKGSRSMQLEKISGLF